MWIGVLGPLRVVAGGEPVRIGGSRLRALLARLAVDAGTAVSTESLADAVWPEGRPENPAHALQSLVTRLRRALPDRSVLRSVPMGYRLDLRPEDVDLLRFEALTRDGRRELRDGGALAAAEVLRTALELWRGDPFVDVPPAPFVDAVTVRLTERWLGAVEDRIEAELACGAESPGTVAELEALVAVHPLRERLRVLLLRELDREGRQAEALRAFEEYRAVLAAELGSDPGPELRDLHLRLLRGTRPTAPPRTGLRSTVRSTLTSFVGREEERGRVAERLRHGRLVTLVGAGGVGKTRLATTVAADLPGTVRVVELARVADAADVAFAVAAALGLGGAGASTDVVSRLAEAVSATETVIVLDNCEHVLDAAAHLVHELLGRCPRLRVLATSREPLGITGEVLLPVQPLEPDTAARLFTDRARAVCPGFVPTDDVARVCRRLDGLPLAIELAAARLRSMSFPQLAARLDDRFRLLTGGSRTALPRHRTLRAVVAWSWDLLTEVERDAIERLAAFPASFAPDAAEHVGIALETLDALVDKSLLALVGDRYHLLDTIREYGLERLSETGRLAAARARHAACFLDLAERAEPHLRGAGQLPWIERLATERDNLTSALRVAGDSGATETAVRMGAALGFFWVIHGDHAEAVARLRPVLRAPGPDDTRTVAVAGYLLNAMLAGQLTEASAGLGRLGRPEHPLGAFVDALLGLADGDFTTGLTATERHLAHPDPWTRAMVWLARAFLHGSAGDIREGHRDLTAAAAGFREAGERWGLALSLMSLAAVHTAAGDVDQAIAALDEATALVRELGTDDSQRVWLAGIRISAGDVETARAELRDVVAHARSAHHVALARLSLADLARHDGDLAEAVDQLRLAEEHGTADDAPFQVLHLTGTGFLATARGDLDTAEDQLRAALRTAAAMPDLPMAAAVGVGLAQLLARRGKPHTAATVLGASCAVRGGPDARNPDVVRLTRDLEESLGRQDFAAAYDDGRGVHATMALELLQQV